MNNTHMSQYIPLSAIQKSAGTWTLTVASDVVKDVRTAAAAAFTASLPLPLPANSQYRQGARLKSVDVFYAIATADATDFATVSLKRKTLPPTGTAVSAAEVSLTPDAAHDTAAKRKAQGNHTLTAALTSPVYLDDDAAYELVLVVDCAAGTVFTFYGARANYELRLG